MRKLRAILICLSLLTLMSACARYFDRGAVSITRLGPPVRVSPEQSDAAEPVVAAASDGTAYIAWVEHRPRKEADLLVARLDREANSVGPPVRVNPRGGEATAWRGDPPTLAVAPDGALYVGWTAREASEGHATTLYLSASRDGGQTFAPPVKVNDDEQPGVHGMHSLAVARDGRIHLAWLDERNLGQAEAPGASPEGQKKMEQMERNREVFTAYSADGGRSFSRNRRVAAEACPCCKTAVAVSGDGRVYLAWRQVLPGEYRHIAVSSSGDGGETFSAPKIVSDDQWVIAGCPVSGPALSVAGDGTLGVMWYTAGERGTPGLYWAQSKDGGESFSESRLFAPGQAFGTPLLLAHRGENNLVVWANYEGGAQHVMAAPLLAADRTGTPVVANAELPSAATSGDQIFIGFIINADDRRAIWVLRAKPPMMAQGAGAAHALSASEGFPVDSIASRR
ncbi:MAG TPA: sialidase family protein [Pyrinomonadaceae bacterium]